MNFVIPSSDSDLSEGDMARALSVDLRSRVLAASAGGMSARSAAARFGIGISTAIAWIANARQGRVSATKQGRRGGSRLDAHEAFIISMIEASKDVTLNEMVARLNEDRSVCVGRSTLDVWLRKRGFTFKKRPHMHWSRSAQTSRSDARTGSMLNLILILNGSSSSTKPAYLQRWPVFVVARCVENVADRPSRTATGKPRRLPARSGFRA